MASSPGRWPGGCCCYGRARLQPRSGRPATEREHILSALKRAAAGETLLLTVGGEPGIGKTRLVADCAARARELGFHVLIGGCLDVGDGTLPYAAIVEALRPLRAELGPEVFAEVTGQTGGDLWPLLPELGLPGEPRPHGGRSNCCEPCWNAWLPAAGAVGYRGRAVGRSVDPASAHVSGTQPARSRGVAAHLPRRCGAPPLPAGPAAGRAPSPQQL